MRYFKSQIECHLTNQWQVVKIFKMAYTGSIPHTWFGSRIHEIISSALNPCTQHLPGLRVPSHQSIMVLEKTMSHQIDPLARTHVRYYKTYETVWNNSSKTYNWAEFLGQNNKCCLFLVIYAGDLSLSLLCMKPCEIAALSILQPRPHPKDGIKLQFYTDFCLSHVEVEAP
jgi:hypothetical protein